MKKLVSFLFFLFPFSFDSFNYSDDSTLAAQIISTIAGNNIHGYSGDGGPATDAELYFPYKIAFDTVGNIYISDQLNNVIRKINTSGIISTIAGNGYLAGGGHGGYSGDGGPATDAEIATPAGIIIDKNANIYIADFHNSVVRKVNTSGIISTAVGNHSYGYSGNGGPASAAELSYPEGLAIDAAGNLCISDCNNGTVRKVNTSGIIADFAGEPTYFVGYSGNGGPATNAELNTPSGLSFDSFGNLYIVDEGNNVIRKVDATGIISTYAGNGLGSGYGGDGGPATAAMFSLPSDVSIDRLGNLYIADTENQVIRKVNTSGIINTIAGNYSYGAGYSGNGGPATAAELHEPIGVTSDMLGNIYIADMENMVVRKVTVPTGIHEIKQENSVSVYPNPSNGQFTLSLSNITDKCDVEIYNMLGEKVYSQFTIHNSPFAIDLSSQPNGVYLYRVINETGGLLGQGKVVVEK